VLLQPCSDGTFAFAAGRRVNETFDSHGNDEQGRDLPDGFDFTLPRASCISPGLPRLELGRVKIVLSIKVTSYCGWTS